MKKTKKKIDYSKHLNKKFNRLTILRESEKKGKRRFFLCLCECGTYKDIPGDYVVSGRTKSCGCLQKEIAIKRFKKINLKKQKEMTEESVILTSAKQIFNKNYSDGNLLFEDFLLMTQKDCHYCGAPPSNKNHVAFSHTGKPRSKRHKGSYYYKFPDAFFIYNGLDRIDSSLLHDKENLVPCCSTCNTMKMDSSYKDFLLRIEKIYKKHFIR